MSTDEPGNQIPPMKHTGIAPPRDTLADILRMIRQQEARLDRIGVDLKRIDDRIHAAGGYITTMVVAVTIAALIVAIVVVGAILV